MAKLPAEQSLSSTWWQRFHKQSTIAVALTEVKIEESTTEDQNPPRLTLVRTATYPAATPSMKQDPSATQRQRSASTSCVPTDVRKDPLADDRRCIQTKRKEQRTAVSENVTKTFQSLLHKDSHQHGERTSSTSTAGFIQAIIRKRIQRLKNKKAEPDQRNGESSIIDSRVGSANTSGHTVTNEILSPDSKRPDKPNSNEDPNAAPTIRDRFRSDGLAIERRGRLGLEISASQADLIGQPTLVGQLPTTNHLESPFKNISRRPFRGRRLKHLMFGHRQRKREGQGSAMRETDTVEEQSLEGTPLTSDRAASEYGTLATRSHVGIRPRRPVDTIFDVPSFGSSSATTGPSNPTYHLENVEEWLKATNSNAHPSSNNHSGTSGHYFPAPPHDSVPHLNPMQHLNAGPYLTPIPPLHPTRHQTPLAYTPNSLPGYLPPYHYAMPMSISPPPHAVHPYFNLPLANPISPPPNTRPTHIFNDHQLFPTQHSTYTPPPPFPFQQTLFPPPPPAQPMPDPYRRLPLRYARSRQQQRHASLHDLFILGPSTPGPSPPSHSAADPVPTQPGPSPSSSSSTPSYPQQLAQRPARRFSASDVEVSAETVAEGNRTLCRNLRLRGV